MANQTQSEEELKILVFSTETISDPGIDFAGSAHLPYPPAARVIPVPCSGGIKPGWILHALNQGFDGVFIAADGTDCTFLPDCTRRTGDLVDRAQELLTQHGHDPKRLRMAAICSVCAESFVKHIQSFESELSRLNGNGGDPLGAP